MFYVMYSILFYFNIKICQIIICLFLCFVVFFICSCIYFECNCAVSYSFIYLFIHLCMYLFTHLCMYAFIYISTYSFIHLLIYLFIYLFTYLFIYLLIYHVNFIPLILFRTFLALSTQLRSRRKGRRLLRNLLLTGEKEWRT